MNDIYYNPEEFGLEKLAEIELQEPDYSFDLLVIWRQTATGRLLFDTDSGCSCPTPFEDYCTPESVGELREFNLEVVAEIIREKMKNRPADLGEAMAVVRNLADAAR